MVSYEVAMGLSLNEVDPTSVAIGFYDKMSKLEYIAAGFRSAVLAGWGAVLLVEWFGNDRGVGFRAHYWYDAHSFEGMMGWGLVMMIIILTFDRMVMDRVVRHFRSWRTGEQQWSR